GEEELVKAREGKLGLRKGLLLWKRPQLLGPTPVPVRPRAKRTCRFQPRRERRARRHVRRSNRPGGRAEPALRLGREALQLAKQHDRWPRPSRLLCGNATPQVVASAARAPRGTFMSHAPGVTQHSISCDGHRRPPPG